MTNKNKGNWMSKGNQDSVQFMGVTPQVCTA